MYVDGNPNGFTNKPIQVQTGTHTFDLGAPDLGAPRNYKPSSQTVTVKGTLASRPMIIAFQPL